MASTLDRQVVTEAAALLEQPGVWTRGTYDDGKQLCLVGAVLRPTCTPGDNHLWRVWLNRNGLNEGWNDTRALDVYQVVARLRTLPDPTEADMADMFGPQWLAIRDLVRRIAVLTGDEVAAWDAAWGAARNAARNAAWGATRGATRDAAWDAAWGATWGAAQDAAWDAAWGAARALVVRDLIGSHGFTQDHYDTLTAPWATVIGRVHPDDADRLVVA